MDDDPVTDLPSVLIIDDEVEAASLLALHFERDGYEVHVANNGPEGLKLAYEHEPSAVVLDVRMPGMDGYEVCGRLRDFSDAVILFVTVVNDRKAIIRGLQLGADDYLIKPFNYLVLLARIEACLRRRSIQRERAGQIPFTDWLLDTERHEVVIGKRRVQLTPKEFDILRYFMKHPDTVHAADEILERLWGPEYVGDPDLVKQFVYRLRSKLEPNPSEPQYFVTIRGSGYAFEPDTRPDMRDDSRKTAVTSGSRMPAARSHALVGAAQRSTGLPELREAGEGARGPSPIRLDLRRAAMRWATVGLVMVAVLSLGLVAQASTTALPGDRSYGIRSVFDNLLRLAPRDDSAGVEMHLRFSDAHIREISELIESGRHEDVLLAVAELEADLQWARDLLDRMATDDPTQAIELIGATTRRLELQVGQLAVLREIATPPAGAAIDYAIEVTEMEWDKVQNDLRAKAASNLQEQLLGSTRSGFESPTATPHDFGDSGESGDSGGSLQEPDAGGH